MFKSTQMNQNFFFGIADVAYSKALVLMSFSTNLCYAQNNSTNHCDGSVQSAEFTQHNSVAAATACGAACAASVIAINAAQDANFTACNLIVAEAATACSTYPETCNNTASAQLNGCKDMLDYVNASRTDSITQTFAACNASINGTTACNAAFSSSYIACNVAHSTDYVSCNNILLVYARVCVAQGATADLCALVLGGAEAFCKASASIARDSCASNLASAYSRC